MSTSHDVTEARSTWTVARVVLLVVLLAALCVALWTFASSGPLSTHSDNEVERLSPNVAEDEGVGQALADLHGHLNWVIWGRNELDEARWDRTLQATLAELRDQGLPDIATELRQVDQLLDADASLFEVHDRMEVVEFRYANAHRQ